MLRAWQLPLLRVRIQMSKLYPGGLSTAAPIAWRATGAVSAGQAAPASEARQESYLQGVAAGEAAGAQRAAAQLAPVLQNFAAAARELAGGRARARLDAEESMVRLAIAIARRICSARSRPTRKRSWVW
jgi:flagellar biosynthesis/type III secretory pathway protein FliH